MKRITLNEKFELVFFIKSVDRGKVDILLNENKYVYTCSRTPYSAFFEYKVNTTFKKGCCLWNLINNLIFV